MLSNSTKEAIIKSLDEKGLLNEIPDPRTRGQWSDFMKALRTVRRELILKYGEEHQFVTELDSVIDPAANLIQLVEQTQEAISGAVEGLVAKLVEGEGFQKLTGGLRDTLREIVNKIGSGDSAGASRMLNLKDLADAKKNGGGGHSENN